MSPARDAALKSCSVAQACRAPPLDRLNPGLLPTACLSVASMVISPAEERWTAMSGGRKVIGGVYLIAGAAMIALSAAVTT